MKRAGELRQQAERYRRLMRQISDPRTVQAICELVGEFEMTAADLEKRHLIRERAHEIWVERGVQRDATSSIGSWLNGNWPGITGTSGVSQSLCKSLRGGITAKA
jgi:hypothetical protein